MQTIKNSMQIDIDSYPYHKLGPLDELLFMDIETTGFTARSSALYMIGCAYYSEGRFHSIQWFGENLQEEELLLYHFFNFAQKYSVLIHYNGNHFDIPYLEAKCKQYDLQFDFKRFNGIDIYKRLLPYKSFLKLRSMKQRAIEHLLLLERDDSFDGGQLISIYQDYVHEPSEFNLQLLLNHNYEDLRGLVRIVPALSFTDIFNEELKVEKAGRSPYKDLYGNECGEVIMDILLPSSIPVRFSTGFSDCYFTCEGNHGKLRVAIHEGELKYFYPNYKEYYYIPAEDISIHKSVGTFVDAGHREPAKASNCYAKKTGMFLPQWDPLFEPIFREQYNDKTMYFELTDEFKRDSKKFSKYASHLLNILAHPNV